MYLEIDEGFPEHPKTLQLCASLESPTAFAYVINFWRWACRSCQDGDLRGISSYAIEEAAKYHKHDGKLFAALAAKLGPRAGFIDVDDSGAPTRIHNWEKRTGAAIERMENEAERKRLYRAHKDGKCGQGCKWCKTDEENPKDGSGMSAGHPQDIPTQTSPDKSSPVQTSQDPDPVSVSSPLSLLASGSGSEQPLCQSEPKDAEKIRAVFAHYRGHHPKALPNPAPTGREWKLVRDRLREGYTVETLCKAIDGYHKSPHHLGENESNTEYLSLALFMRDASHVDAGVRFDDAKAKPVMSVREMRSQRAGKGFLATLDALGMGDKANGQG